MNVLAGIGTIFATRSLAIQMFGRAEIGFLAALFLVFGTFWSEYVYGHWPHSVSLLFVTMSLLAFFGSLEQTNHVFRKALVSGLALGLALLFRLDSILAVPAYFLAIILYARQPIKLMVGGTLGLAPAIVVLSVTNFQKFGSLNPFSYGRVTGGATDASAHAAAAAIIFLAILIVTAIAVCSKRQINARWIGPAVLAIFAAALAVPATYEVFRAMAVGFVRLVIDTKGITHPEIGVVHLSDGTVLFWGFPKKALAQSLPWLGVLILIAFRSWNEHKRPLVVAAIFAVVWMMPFLQSSWHGGLGSNMRYFLPILPVMASVAAFLVYDLANAQKNWLMKSVIGLVCGAGLVFGWTVLHPSAGFGSHQILSTLVFVLVLVLILTSSLIGMLGVRTNTKSLQLFAVGLGFGVAWTLAGADFINGQNRRVVMDLQNRNVSTIPERTLLYGAPERFVSAFSNPEQVLALPDRLSGKFDTKLISGALDAGYVVLMSPNFVKSPDIANGGFNVVKNARWSELNLVQIINR